jgi:hypothetical protein
MPSRFTLTMIDTARGNLDALPEADNNTREVSLRQAIRALTPTLRKLERKGYSRQKLVELLAEQNIHISLSSLKGYLGDKGTKKPTGRQQSRQPAATAPASAAASIRPAAAPAPASERDRREPATGPAGNGTQRAAGART